MNASISEALCFRTTVVDSDVEAVRELTASTGFFRDDEVAVAVELVMEKRRDGDRSSYQFLFAERDGKVAGYACFGEIPCTIGSFDLYWIVVGPQHQGSGIGRTLMNKVEAAVSGMAGRLIYVETSSTPRYLPTRTFYTGCGYEIACELADYYSPGDAKVIYCKRLASKP